MMTVHAAFPSMQHNLCECLGYFIYFQAVWCREVGRILYAVDSRSDGERVKPLRSERIQKTSFGRVSPSGLCEEKEENRSL